MEDSEAGRGEENLPGDGALVGRATPNEDAGDWSAGLIYPTIYHKSDLPGDDRPEYLRGNMNLLALDTETNGLAWEDGDFPFIATASDYDRNYVFQLVEHPDNNGDDDVEGDRFALREAIMQADGLIFHNASFDVHMLNAAGIMTMEELLAKPIFDTNILARLVLDEWDFRLKHLATKYIDPDAAQYETRIRECMLEMGIIRKLDQKDVGSGAYYEVWKAYRKEMEEYALYDTRYTYDLYHMLRSKATTDQLRCFDLERAVQPTIIHMEHRGGG